MAKMGCAQCGGAKMKAGGAKSKMAKGGVTLTQKGAGYAKAQTGGTNSKMGIYGMPQENMGTSGQYGKMAKGGTTESFAPNRAVMASCKNGMVRDANGKCVMERKMAKGGATSFGMLSVKAGIDKNPKATAADRIVGAKKKKK